MRLYRKALTVTAITASIFLLTISLTESHLFTRLENISYDWTVKSVRGDKPVSDKIAIILIDDASLDALDARLGRWPWPRGVYSDLLEFLSKGSPEAILFDILFTETQDPSSQGIGPNDSQLVIATKNYENIYHAMELLKDVEDDLRKSSLNEKLPGDFVDNFSISNVKTEKSYKPVNNNYRIPFEQLYKASHGIGVVQFNPDSDGVFRRTIPIREYQGSFFPVLGIAPLTGNSDVVIGGSSIKIGGRRIPLGEDGKYVLNMYGKFNPYSISGLLNSQRKIDEGELADLEVNPAEFNGKIVYIGGSAIGVEDLKTTPGLARTPGVYLHATMASNFILNDFLIPPNRAATILLVLLITAICVPGIVYLKSFIGKIGLPAAVVIGWGVFYYYQFSQNQLYEFVPPAFAALLSGISSLGYIAVTEGREKRKFRNMFSQYVSPEILKVLENQYGNYEQSLSESRRDITVLFTDIRGFTAFSDNTEPEKVVEMLNCYFSNMSDVIFDHRGTIDKFIGDAIMAFWGAPIKVDDHPDLAVSAAIDLIKKLKKVNEELKSLDLGDVKVNIGVGINSGDAIIGNVGSDKKRDYTAIGDTVNLASRLESLNKNFGTNIIISEFTSKRLKGDVLTRIIDEVEVRGKKDTVKIYEPIPYDDEESRKNVSRICRQTDEAFALYKTGDYKAALQLYSQLDDGKLKDIFIQRCEYRLKNRHKA